MIKIVQCITCELTLLMRLVVEYYLLVGAKPKFCRLDYAQPNGMETGIINRYKFTRLQKFQVQIKSKWQS
jgi:hypothetical protein